MNGSSPSSSERPVLARSAEAEHREILWEALGPELQRPSFKRFLLDMPAVGEDEDFQERRDVAGSPTATRGLGGQDDELSERRQLDSGNANDGTARRHGPVST